MSLMKRRGSKPLNALSFISDNAKKDLECPRGLEGIQHDYKVVNIVGKGSTALVYHAIRKTDGEHVALKAVRALDEEMVNRARDEFDILKAIKHPGIVRALGFHVVTDGAVLELAFFDGSQLNNAILRAEDKKFPETQAHRLFVQLLEAIDHCHQLRIVHRDIKPENVLISHDLTQLMLVDFNIAQALEDGSVLSPTCTPAYASPGKRRTATWAEVVISSEKSDIWGAGVCLHMMLCGKIPYVNRSTGEVTLSDILDEINISDGCRSMLKHTLEVDYRMRPAPMILLQKRWARYGPAMSRKASKETHSPDVSMSELPVFELVRKISKEPTHPDSSPTYMAMTDKFHMQDVDSCFARQISAETGMDSYTVRQLSGESGASYDSLAGDSFLRQCSCP
jgi:serine/threonine protein kinase